MEKKFLTCFLLLLPIWVIGQDENTIEKSLKNFKNFQFYSYYGYNNLENIFLKINLLDYSPSLSREEGKRPLDLHFLINSSTALRVPTSTPSARSNIGGELLNPEGGFANFGAKVNLYKKYKPPTIDDLSLVDMTRLERQQENQPIFDVGINFKIIDFYPSEVPAQRGLKQTEILYAMHLQFNYYFLNHELLNLIGNVHGVMLANFGAKSLKDNRSKTYGTYFQTTKGNPARQELLLIGLESNINIYSSKSLVLHMKYTFSSNRIRTGNFLELGEPVKGLESTFKFGLIFNRISK